MQTASPEWANYYRNVTEGDVRAILDIEDIFAEHQFVTHESAHDLYFYGIKKP